MGWRGYLSAFFGICFGLEAANMGWTTVTGQADAAIPAVVTAVVAAVLLRYALSFED
jgi:hypothetical protein